MKKFTKYLSCILLAICSCFFMGNAKAAAPTSITVTSGERLSYIGSTYFAALQTTSGEIVYCLDFWKQTPNGVSMSMIGEGDVGLVYLMQNGYPNKSFTGNASMDKFITASAVWWYLDHPNGDGNLSTAFKTTDSDPYNLRPHIQKLVSGAVGAKAVNASMSAKVGSSSLTLSSDKKYFDSQLVTVSLSNIGSYTVTLTNAPKGTIITDENGNAKTTFNAGSKFKIRVPVSSLGDNLKASVSAEIAASSTTYKVYKYGASGTNYQRVVVPKLYPSTKTFKSSVKFNLVTTRIKISKQDITTKKELPGAKLTLKDKDGKVIETWTSTDKPHYISHLPAGEYTLEELIAPKGYVLSKEKIKFTVTTNGVEKSVVMYNKPEAKPTPTPTPKPTPTPTPTPDQVIEVPKTASSIPLAIYIIGFMSLAGGSGLIYYNAKLKK